MEMVCINNDNFVGNITLNKIYECYIDDIDNIYYILIDDNGRVNQRYLISRFIAIQSYRDRVLADLGI